MASSIFSFSHCYIVVCDFATFLYQVPLLFTVTTKLDGSGYVGLSMLSVGGVGLFCHNSILDLSRFLDFFPRVELLCKTEFRLLNSFQRKIWDMRGSEWYTNLFNVISFTISIFPSTSAGFLEYLIAVRVLELRISSLWKKSNMLSLCLCVQLFSSSVI